MVFSRKNYVHSKISVFSVSVFQDLVVRVTYFSMVDLTRSHEHDVPKIVRVVIMLLVRVDRKNFITQNTVSAFGVII